MSPLLGPLQEQEIGQITGGDTKDTGSFPWAELLPNFEPKYIFSLFTSKNLSPKFAVKSASFREEGLG